MKPVKNIEIPTEELVKKYVELFDKDERGGIEDNVRERVIEYFDWSFEDIYVSVIIVNKLFGTNLRDTYAMAKHIFSYNKTIRQSIECGNEDAVGMIAVGHGISNRKECKESVLYSFATKFCHWLNPDNYPIFDRHVENLLKLYNSDRLLGKGNIRDYKVFKSWIDAFIQKHNLQCTYRELDKFLWYHSSKEVFNK